MSGTGLVEEMVQSARIMAYPQLAVWPALILLTVLCPAAWWLAGVMRGSRLLAVAAAAFLASAVTITLARPGLRSAGADWSRVPSACTITDHRPSTIGAELLNGSTEALLNLALFVPFAVFAVLALGRPILITLAAVLVSISIETVQVVFSVGACDSRDLIRNSAGAGVAAVLAGLLRAGAQAVDSAVVMDQRPRSGDWFNDDLPQVDAGGRRGQGAESGAVGAARQRQGLDAGLPAGREL